MRRHTRLMGFLLTCAVLIGLNIIATVNGVYDFKQGDGDAPATLSREEKAVGASRLAAI